MPQGWWRAPSLSLGRTEGKGESSEALGDNTDTLGRDLCLRK